MPWSGRREFQGKDAYVRKVFQEELTQVGDQLVEISRLVSEAMA
ncbi:MAG TPA: phosphate transport system regulatory protein PhoU, partial [Paenarthrobacter sp.]|nr:phosphate transport system regulatory protein PhoU [Paenarthrobacter sp.]